MPSRLPAGSRRYDSPCPVRRPVSPGCGSRPSSEQGPRKRPIHLLRETGATHTQAAHLGARSGHRLRTTGGTPEEGETHLSPSDDTTVLLINPPDLAAVGRREGRILSYLTAVRRGRMMPPLGLCSLAAVLRKAGVPVSILDADALNLTIEQVGEHVRQVKPTIVGVTTTTIALNAAYQVCKAVRRIDEDILIVLGGPQVSVMPAETADHPAVDVAVSGEGEPTILSLVEAGGDRAAWPAIPGLAYRENGRIVRTGPGRRVKNVNALPLPARDLVPLDRYYDRTTTHERAMSILTARGCPYRCLFCEREVVGHGFRPFDPMRVVDEMQEIVGRYGFREVVIYDDTFTANIRHATIICEEILRRGLRFPWDCRTRVDRVTPKLLRLMKRAGCQRISYGIESANPRILKILRKGITPAQAVQAVRWTRQAGIRSLAYFMLGSPGETRETIEQTIRFSLRLGADFAYYSMTVPWPGSDMWTRAVAEGLVDADYWAEYVRNEGTLTRPLPVFADTPSYRRFIEASVSRAYRAYYLRPAFIVNRILSLRSPRDVAWQAKLAAALVRM